jgi:hypothetical protein
LEAVDGLLQLLAGRRAYPHRRFKITKRDEQYERDISSSHVLGIHR